MTRPVTSHTASVLSVTDLHKSYRSQGMQIRAVQGVSFALGQGDSLGIVGESGSGKSTVARLLLGLEAPDSGAIEIDGQPLAGRVRGRGVRLARARAIQLVFQDPYLSLDPRVPVGEALDAVLRLHTPMDRTARSARVHELLDQIGMGEREAGCLPRHLSGGQRQRVAIARALAVEPRVLVLDEAVSALDVSVQAQVLNVLRDIKAQTGVALVFISHDLGVVRYLCDDAIVMHRGAVVERGATATLLDRPEHPYTRLLLAAVPHPGWTPDAVVTLRGTLAGASREARPVGPTG